MAIIQISKLQVRSGNLVDLPQLDDAEFGWATDAKKLYIGKTTPNENIEILTSYSNIYFSQMNGSYGNLNINAPVTGQTLTYVASSNTWINTGGNASDPGNSSYYSYTPVHLGNVSNVYIGGGSVGYVLQTDGKGSLSWTPKGTLYTLIKAVSNATPIIMTVPNTTPYTNGTQVTITGDTGANANTIVNGKSFYVKLAVDYPTSGNVALYTDSGLTTAAVGTNLGATTPNVAVATALVSGSGGTSGAGGISYSVQYNSGGVSTGDANFLWNYSTQALTLSGAANISGNANVGNLGTSGQIISTIATGTAPLTVSSTTRVANLDVAKSGVANTVNDAAQPNITSTGTLVSVSVTGNANVGNLNTAGNVIASQVTANSNGTGNNFKVGDDAYIGDINVVNTMVIKGQQDGANGYIIFGNGDTTSTLGRASTGPLTYNGAFSAVGNANVGNLGTGGLITATGNIRGGNLTTGGALSVTGNANIGNIGTAGIITATGNITGGNVSATLFTGNLSGTGNSNVGNIGATTFVGNLLGTLSTTGNVTAGNLVLGNASTITVGANTNIGYLTGNWQLTTGSRMQATYADLAEYYEADFDYEPGTVVEFGGEKEVTLAQDGTTRVAGVITTNPAYVMNTGCPGIAVALALQGRVPVKVRGIVRKGDMMVSAGNGFARPWNNAQMGTVIGKAIQNFDGIEGVIEIAVGRL